MSQCRRWCAAARWLYCWHLFLFGTNLQLLMIQSQLTRNTACRQVVCGGTLGIFLAAALQLAGLRVAVVERGPLRGRAQEWNISRKEIDELVRC